MIEFGLLLPLSGLTVYFIGIYMLSSYTIDTWGEVVIVYGGLSLCIGMLALCVNVLVFRDRGAGYVAWNIAKHLFIGKPGNDQYTITVHEPLGGGAPTVLEVSHGHHAHLQGHSAHSIPHGHHH